MKIGIGGGVAQQFGTGNGATVSITGLTAGAAVPGQHAGLAAAMSGGPAILTQAWGSTLDGAEFGTGTAPTDFTATDTGSFADPGVLYLTVTTVQGTFRICAPIRRPAPGALGGLADRNWPVGTAISPFSVTSGFTGSGLAYALSPSSVPLPAGLALAASGQITGTPTTESATVSLVVRATNSGGYAEATFHATITAVEAGTAPMLVSASAGSQAGGDQPITVDVTAACSVDWVLTAADDTLTGSQVAAGTNGSSGVPADFGNAANGKRFDVPADGTYYGSLAPGLLGTTFYIHLSPYDGAGNRSATVTKIGPFALDTVAPGLSSPGAASVMGTTATVSVTSDEASGTLYCGVYPAASTPTAAQIIAGTGATFSDSASPTATVNSFPATGLTAATAYKPHFVQVDGQDNQSAIATGAQFTTAAAPATGPTDTEIAAFAQTTYGSATANHTRSGINLPAAGKYVILISLVPGGGSTFTMDDLNVQLDGVSAARIVQRSPSSAYATAAIYEVDIVSANAAADLLIPFTGSMACSIATSVRLVEGFTSIDYHHLGGSIDNAALTSLTVDIDVASGGLVLLAYASNEAGGNALTVTGLSETIGNVALNGFARHAVQAKQAGLSSETGRRVGVANPGGGYWRALAAVSIS